MTGPMKQCAGVLVVKQGAGNASATLLPGGGWPGACSKVGASKRSVEGLEVRPDADVQVGPGAVALPEQLARIGIERGDPATHAEIVACIADKDSPLRNERRAGEGLPFFGIGHGHIEKKCAGGRIKRHETAVQRREEHAAFRDNRAVPGVVAAGESFRGSISGWRVVPADAPLGRCARVDGPEPVGERS